ncbi:GNAT family N-acetyltransferase [Paenibacillus sp. CAA11]|uniref:GNAT family N-acetyltransferase n=1 Tax=Paenibacillus sp. CAA11 TaxID=1532905 RepID=UPI00131F314A|nr:GNAT family N-acetyltransferase [Paenibacillus sp. CAA11]
MIESLKIEYRDHFPELWSGRLQLRKLKPSDQGELHRIMNEPSVQRYISFSRETTGLPGRLFGHFMESYHTLSALHFALILRGSCRFIGLCSFQHWQENEGRAALGYMLSPDCWNQGLATEAVRTVMTFGFEQMRLNEITARCDPANLASIQVLHKCGFTEELLSHEGIVNEQGRLHRLSRYVRHPLGKASSNSDTLLHK